MKGWDAPMVTTQWKNSKQEFLRAISSHTKTKGSNLQGHKTSQTNKDLFDEIFVDMIPSY